MNSNGPLSTIINYFEQKIHSSPLESRKRVIIVFVIGILAFSCFMVFILPPLMIKALWDWTVPELFPGAVAQGDMIKIMPFCTAVRLFLILLLLASIVKWIQSQPKKNHQQGSIGIDAEVVDISSSLPAQLSIPLTDKENDIAQLVANGLTNKQIASQLNLSERTIEFHLSHIFQKLSVGSRVEVAIWVKKHDK